MTWCGKVVQLNLINRVGICQSKDRIYKHVQTLEFNNLCFHRCENASRADVFLKSVTSVIAFELSANLSADDGSHLTNAPDR